MLRQIGAFAVASLVAVGSARAAGPAPDPAPVPPPPPPVTAPAPTTTVATTTAPATSAPAAGSKHKKRKPTAKARRHPQKRAAAPPAAPSHPSRAEAGVPTARSGVPRVAAVPLSAQFSPASKSVPGSLKLLLAALLGLGLLSLAVVAIPERLLGGVSVRLVDQRGNVIVGSLVLLFGLGIGLLAALVGG